VRDDGSVMMLITPFTAFAPQSVAPGPLITSMRSMSSSAKSCASQKTPEKSGVYSVRPSISTSSLLASTLLKPRAEIAYWLLSARATVRLGARRSTSGKLVAPERRMSSPVITKIDAGASITRSSRRDALVTLMRVSCSRSRSAISATRWKLAFAAGANAASATIVRAGTIGKFFILDPRSGIGG